MASANQKNAAGIMKMLHDLRVSGPEACSPTLAVLQHMLQAAGIMKTLDKVCGSASSVKMSCKGGASKDAACLD